MRADFGPQRDLFDPERFGHSVTLIGLGGAGSAIAWALLKMGVMQVVGYDPDEVEEHNVPAQLLYSMQEVGLSKAEAITEFMLEHTVDSRQDFIGKQQRVDADHLVEFDGVVISAVDSMASRKEIWRLIHPHDDDANDHPQRYQMALENETRVPLYVDCRMAARIVQVHIVTPESPESVEAYESWFFDDEEAASLPYGARTFIGSAMTLAGYVADQLAAFSRGEEPRQFAELDLETVTVTASRTSRR